MVNRGEEKVRVHMNVHVILLTMLFMGLNSTLIYTSELILCFTICVPSATRHNILFLRLFDKLRKVYNHFLNVSYSFAFFCGNFSYNDLHICRGKNRFSLSQLLTGPSSSGNFGARFRK